MNKVSVQTKDGITRVVLNRPDVKNAFDPEMIQELTQTFVQISSDADCRVVVLSGEGTSFCAGADLNWMKSMAAYTLEQNRSDSDQLFAMFEAIRVCPAPVIGRLQGHVMGGGLGLAAVCDISAAETNTAFCFSEVKLGLVPAVISSFVLEKIQRSAAQRYMLSGEVFSASDALVMGLIHHVGSLSDVDNFVEKMIKTFLTNGPEAVRETKKLLRSVAGNESSAESGIESSASEMERKRVRRQTTQLIAERRVSSEGQEGLKSFFEKRSPSWRKS